MSTDALEQVIRAAREGAAKAARNDPDSDEFNEVAQFIGSQLEHLQPHALQKVEERLRREDKCALAWYLNLQRTLCGTVPIDSHLQHLVFLPVEANPALNHPLYAGAAVHEIAGSLEKALDLGPGALELHPEGIPLGTLERTTPIRWRALATSEQALALPSETFGPVGALIGRWRVAQDDRPRLARKLLHAMQRTPALSAWKVRTEALLEEHAAGHRVRVYPLVLLQDFFTMIRQVQLNSALELAARKFTTAERLVWTWAPGGQSLSWRLVDGQGEELAGSSPFPDEPAELIERQLERVARRLQLELTPAP